MQCNNWYVKFTNSWIKGVACSNNASTWSTFVPCYWLIGASASNKSHGIAWIDLSWPIENRIECNSSLDRAPFIEGAAGAIKICIGLLYRVSGPCIHQCNFACHTQLTTSSGCLFCCFVMVFFFFFFHWVRYEMFHSTRDSIDWKLQNQFHYFILFGIYKWQYTKIKYIKYGTWTKLKHITGKVRVQCQG